MLSGSSCLAALSSRAGASLPKPEANATWPRSKFTRACWNSSRGLASAAASSSRALPNAPAFRLACAGPGCGRRTAPDPRSAPPIAGEMPRPRPSRRVPELARPIVPARPRRPHPARLRPRPGAKPAGPDRPADRSLRPAPHVSAAGRWTMPTGRLPSAPAGAGTGCGCRTPPGRPLTAGAAAWIGIPSRPAARQTRYWSPDGSAAASCRSCRVWSGRASSWRR